MAVTIAETGGHVTETALKTPLSPPVTMRRNDRSHSPKYAHDPYAYLKDVLTRLPTHKASRIEELLPHRWQPAV